MKKRSVLIILLLILIALSAGAYYLRTKLKSLSSATTITYTVIQETSENCIEISGNISAANEQTMQASGPGTVKKINIKQGDSVKKGMLVLELDSTSEEYALAKQDYDIMQKRITGALKEVELMKKQRALLFEKFENRKVYARFDGVAAQLKVSEGDVVVAQDELGTILDRSYLTATVEVVETDASKLKIGQKVAFLFPAYEKKNVSGSVVSYPSVSRITTRGATVVDAEVRIDNPPAEILTGYSFTGKIEISMPETVVLVERQAIGHDQGKAFAEIIAGESLRRVDVTVEPFDSVYVKILDGLRTGDVLKTQSQNKQSGSNADRSSSGQAGKSSSSSANNKQGPAPGGAAAGGPPPGGI